MNREELRNKFYKEEDLPVLESNNAGGFTFTSEYVHWLEQLLIKRNEEDAALGADIRNKLTPPKNLCAMLKNCDHRFSDNEKLNEIIKEEIENTERCVDYLSKIR